MDFYLGLIQIIGVHTLLGLSAYCVLQTGQVSLAQAASSPSALTWPAC
jgi:branched-chain amino acid transport system permease protein